MYIQTMMAMPLPMEEKRPSSSLKMGSKGLNCQLQKPTMATAAKAATTRTVKKVSVFSSQSRPMMLMMEKTMTTATFTAKLAAGLRSMSFAA